MSKMTAAEVLRTTSRETLEVAADLGLIPDNRPETVHVSETETDADDVTQTAITAEADLFGLFEQIEHADSDAAAKPLLAQVRKTTDGMLRALDAADRPAIPAILRNMAPIFSGAQRQANMANLHKTLSSVRRSVVATLIERKILGTRGFSQSDVARMLGCTQGRISQLKSDVTGATARKREREAAEAAEANVTSTPDTDPAMPGPSKPETATAVWVAEQIRAFLATMPDAVVPDGPEDRAALASALDALTDWAASVA